MIHYLCTYIVFCEAPYTSGFERHYRSSLLLLIYYYYYYYSLLRLHIQKYYRQMLPFISSLLVTNNCLVIEQQLILQNSFIICSSSVVQGHLSKDINIQCIYKDYQILHTVSKMCITQAFIPTINSLIYHGHGKCSQMKLASIHLNFKQDTSNKTKLENHFSRNCLWVK